MWIQATTHQVFRYHWEIRAAFPRTSFPSELLDAHLDAVGVVPVLSTDHPEYNRLTSKVVEAAPVFSSGAWRQVWQVVTLTSAEQAAVVEEIRASIVNLAQARLDTFARTRNYDSILSACTYATSSVPQFQAEGQYCVDARDATWTQLYAVMADVQVGNRPMPMSFSEIVAELPDLVWPA